MKLETEGLVDQQLHPALTLIARRRMHFNQKGGLRLQHGLYVRR
jgi:hypothetical protein